MNENLPTAPAPHASAIQAAGTEGNCTTVEMVMPRHVAAVVPFGDHEAYGRLTMEQKARVSHLLQLFIEIEQAPDGIVAAADRVAIANGMRRGTLLNLRSAFKARGWRALAKIYRGPEKLPEEFVQEVRRCIEANARSTRSALSDLKSRWAAGESIPGYGTWREYWRATRPLDDVPERYPFGFIPEGWSESNLYTKQSSRAERMLKRRGMAAARRYLPSVTRDLSDLRPLELIVIDDFELDFMVEAFNPETKRWQICRCAGLLAIDAATRRKLAVGLKPRFKDDDGKRLGLTRSDVQMLLYSVFSTHGLPDGYGCTILCENAAAAITGDFELALELLLGVQVARTGLITDRTLRNGFKQAGGKPWEKGMIESLFNLVHNTAAALPGQKGASYELKPADLEAKVLYAEKLLNTEGLPPEAAEQLRTPFLRFDAALTALERIFAAIENRRDHRCQGFLEVHHYRLPGSAQLLPEGAAELTLATAEQLQRAEILPLRESPVERWERLRAQVHMRPVAGHLLACLLLTPKKVTLRNHKLTFSHAGEGYTYFDAASPVLKQPEGSELLAYFDPARPQTLHVTDLRGQYLGQVQRRGYRAAINDPAAIAEEAAAVSHLIKSLVAGLRERHGAEDAQLVGMREHNARILEQHGLEAPAITSPAARSSAPRTALDGTSGDKADTDPKQGAQGLSRKLAHASCPEPVERAARDAFTAHREALARGIAGDVTAQEAGKARSDALQGSGDDLDPSQLL